MSHLLKRLLGETVKLVVKHGRDLGAGARRSRPARAGDRQPRGQRPRRDGLGKGGGTLTIQTYAVRADQVAELGSDILPVADYSALSVDRHRLRHSRQRARQDFRALLHHQGSRQGHRPRASRPSTASSSSRAASSSPIPRSARAPASSSTCRSTARRPSAGQAAQAPPSPRRMSCGAPAPCCWSRTSRWSAASPSAR